MNATSDDLVSVSGRGRQKDTIHRADCPYAMGADSFYVRPLNPCVGQTGSMSHRLYKTCGHCLKGLSTFRLPGR
jgi:hypothetical protein